MSMNFGREQALLRQRLSACGTPELAAARQAETSATLQFLGAPTFSAGVALTTILLLGGIGFLAGWFPARRAVSIQPAAALRYE